MPEQQVFALKATKFAEEAMGLSHPENKIYFYSDSFNTSVYNAAVYNEGEDVNIALVRNGDEAKIYVNGVHIKSQFGWDTYIDSDKIRFGWGHPNEWTSILITPISFWDRALDGEEIKIIVIDPLYCIFKMV